MKSDLNSFKIVIIIATKGSYRRILIMIEISFEPRKVVAVGYTRYFAIPKVWLKSVGADVGDKLQARMNANGELTISPVREG
jgi:hypothetical protein